MTDNLIRAAFHQSILKSAHDDPSTFVLDELGLKHGENRADIAVLNGRFLGYEIKTEKDTLNRLSSQIIAYSEIFDRAFIISAKRHLEKVTNLVPDWWGIFEIKQRKDDSFSFPCLRKGKLNKAKDAYGIAQLLWKSEALELLNNVFSCKVREKSTREELYNILIPQCTVQELGDMVLGCLKARQGWRTNPKRLS